MTPAAAPSATLAYDSGLGDVTDAGNTALASFSGLSLSGGPVSGDQGPPASSARHSGF